MKKRKRQIFAACLSMALAVSGFGTSLPAQAAVPLLESGRILEGISAQNTTAAAEVGTDLTAPLLSEDGFYELDSREDLDWFAKQVNEGGGVLNARLMADIDMGGSANPWTIPIGLSSIMYSGIFDGNGHTLTRFYAKMRIAGRGFFGYTNQAQIQNLKIQGEMSSTKDMVGVLIGKASNTTCKNCTMEVTLEGKEIVGGLIGSARDITLENCSSSGNISGTSNVGGLIGEMGRGSSQITQCTNQGSITAVSDCVGGLIGNANNENRTTILSCSNTADIETTGKNAGGLIGYGGPWMEVEDCTNRGEITASTGVGGLVGLDCGKIIDCVNRGIVSSKAKEGICGGILGARTEKGAVLQISGCRNEAAVTSSGVNSSAGGIVGKQMNGAVIEDCENLGAVSGVCGVGGIAGLLNSSSDSLTVRNCTNKAVITGLDCGSDLQGKIGGIAGSLVRSTTQNTQVFIRECANQGNVVQVNAPGTDGMVGGLIGYLQGSAYENSTAVAIQISNSYSRVDKIQGNAHVGGLIGKLLVTNSKSEEYLVVSNCYSGNTLVNSLDTSEGMFVGSLELGKDSLKSGGISFLEVYACDQGTEKLFGKIPTDALDLTRVDEVTLEELQKIVEMGDLGVAFQLGSDGYPVLVEKGIWNVTFDSSYTSVYVLNQNAGNQDIHLKGITVLDGTDFSFFCDTSGGYAIRKLYCNGTVLEPTDSGIYVVENISEDIVIQILTGEGLFGTGDGSEDDPYIITLPEGLSFLAQQVNRGESYEDIYFELGSNLDMSSVCNEERGSWVSIGTTESTPFQGNFDGKGYTISNLYLNSENFIYNGLFGYIKQAELQNLHLDESCYLRTTYPEDFYVGSLAGRMENARMQDCSSEAVVEAIVSGASKEAAKGYSYIGGLVGYSDVDRSIGSQYIAMQNVVFSGQISATGYTNPNSKRISVGGAAGLCNGVMADCQNAGEIKVFGKTATDGKDALSFYVGGVVGCGHYVRQCVNRGKLYLDVGKSMVHAGGIMSWTTGSGTSSADNEVRHCQNNGQIQVASAASAVIAGVAYGQTPVIGSVNLGKLDYEGAGECLIYHVSSGTWALSQVKNYYLEGTVSAENQSHVEAVENSIGFTKETLSAEAIWNLNVLPDSQKSAEIWAMGDGIPVYADEDHPVIYAAYFKEALGKTVSLSCNDEVYGKNTAYFTAGSNLMLSISRDCYFKKAIVNGVDYTDTLDMETNFELPMKSGNVAIETEVVSAEAGEVIELIQELEALLDERLSTDTVFIEAKQAYDALTEEQQKEVGEEYLSVIRIAAEDNRFTVTLDQDCYVYDGKAHCPAVMVSSGTLDLVEGQDYTLRYYHNVEAGKAMVKVVLKGIYSGSVKEYFTIEAADLEDYQVTLEKSYRHTGKKICPIPVVSQGKVKLLRNVDYTLTYQNHVNPGMAKVIVKGTGNYQGTITANFRISAAKGKSYTVDKLVYQVLTEATAGGTVKVTGASNQKATSVTIPSSIKIGKDTYKVTEIGANAFKNYKSLTSVTIGNQVTTIGKNAFWGDSKCKKIVITSKKLTSVGGNAWKGIHKNAVIQVPSAKLKSYQKLLKNKGQEKTVVIKK